MKKRRELARSLLLLILLILLFYSVLMKVPSNLEARQPFSFLHARLQRPGAAHLKSVGEAPAATGVSLAHGLSNSSVLIGVSPSVGDLPARPQLGLQHQSQPNGLSPMA